MFRRLQFTFHKEQFLYLAQIKSYLHYKERWITHDVDKFQSAQDIKLLLMECELKPSEHACKIFFNCSKLRVISFFAKNVHFLPPNHASRWFCTNSRNTIGRIPSMVIPLLAIQDLTPMLDLTGVFAPPVNKLKDPLGNGQWWGGEEGAHAQMNVLLNEVAYCIPKRGYLAMDILIQT